MHYRRCVCNMLAKATNCKASLGNVKYSTLPSNDNCSLMFFYFLLTQGINIFYRSKIIDDNRGFFNSQNLDSFLRFLSLFLIFRSCDLHFCSTILKQMFPVKRKRRFCVTYLCSTNKFSAEQRQL